MIVRPLFVLTVIAVWNGVIGPKPSYSMTPESPEVQKLLASGFGRLASVSDNRTGAKAVAGLAFIKYGQPDHPLVAEAVQAIQNGLSKSAIDSPGALSEGRIFIYTSSLCLIFLCNLDAEKYRAEIEKILGRLLELQKANGCWGYPGAVTGDTSMTQYAVLALWEAEHAGIQVDLKVWVDVCNWLLRTQTPNGAFGYQGQDPGEFIRVEQSGVRNSMTAAGAGSLYICADHFSRITGNRIFPLASRRQEGESPLRRVQNQVVAAPAGGDLAEEGANPDVRVEEVGVDIRRLKQAAADADAWLRTNYNIWDETYPLYFLYTLERYESFRTGGVDALGGLEWYEDGVSALSERQRADGGWNQHSTVGDTSGTAFGLLFLLRSTKQSLDPSSRYGSGTLVGGRGIPVGGDGTAMANGQTPPPLVGPAEEIFARLGNPQDPEFDRAIERLRVMADEGEAPDVNEHAARLRELAGDASPEARVAAVRLLAQGGDLDDVATLIYALTDPDERVVLTARDGLRRRARRFTGYGIEAGQTAATREAAITRWKSWFRRIRPDAEFSP